MEEVGGVEAKDKRHGGKIKRGKYRKAGEMR